MAHVVALFLAIPDQPARLVEGILDAVAPESRADIHAHQRLRADASAKRDIFVQIHVIARGRWRSLAGGIPCVGFEGDAIQIVPMICLHRRPARPADHAVSQKRTIAPGPSASIITDSCRPSVSSLRMYCVLSLFANQPGLSGATFARS